MLQLEFYVPFPMLQFKYRRGFAKLSIQHGLCAGLSGNDNFTYFFEKDPWSPVQLASPQGVKFIIING